MDVQHQDLYLQYVMKILVVAPVVQITLVFSVTVVKKGIMVSLAVYHVTAIVRVLWKED